MLTSQGQPLIRGFQFFTNSEVIKYIRRVMGPLAENLVEYYVPATDRQVIAVWRNRLDGRVHEIVNWDPAKGITRLQIRFIRYWLSDRRRQDNVRARALMRSRMRAQLHDMDERSRGRKDWNRWLASKMNNVRRDNPRVRLGLIARPKHL